MAIGTSIVSLRISTTFLFLSRIVVSVQKANMIDTKEIDTPVCVLESQFSSSTCSRDFT